jgi:hypothetical protein
MGWTTEESGFDSRQKKKVFFVSVTFRPDTEPIQPPRQLVPAAV